MKKIYKSEIKPHLEKALQDHANGVLYVPKGTSKHRSQEEGN